MSEPELKAGLREYITKEIAAGRELPALRDDMDLMSTGVLDSLSLMRLVTHVETEYKVSVNLEEVVPENFHSIDSIASFLKLKLKG